MSEVKFLLKFGQREHIEAFIKSGLFFSNAESFWGIENDLKIKGQGDILEAGSRIFAQNMTIHDYDDHSVVAQIGKSNSLFRYDAAKHIPVFCMFAVREQDCYLDDKRKLRIKLSDETKQTIREHFPNANAVAIIDNPRQFLLDVERSLKTPLKHELVHYFNIDKGFPTDNGQIAMDMEYMKYLTQDTSPVVENGKKTYSFHVDYVYRVLFCKDVFFEREQEYRIVLPSEEILTGTMYPVEYSTKIAIQDLDEFLLET